VPGQWTISTLFRHRNLPDEDYEAGVAAPGKECLAELTWLLGYYSALALAVFRPALPESLFIATAAFPCLLRRMGCRRPGSGLFLCHPWPLFA
jgi:hypothetical protein